jgi:hypothetical protein
MYFLSSWRTHAVKKLNPQTFDHINTRRDKYMFTYTIYIYVPKILVDPFEKRD